MKHRSKRIIIRNNKNKTQIRSSRDVKMKPFSTNQQSLTWLCLYPVDETTSNRQKAAHIVFSVTNFIMLLSGLASSVAYFVKFASIDLEKSLYALLQIVTFTATLYALVIAFLLRHKIPALRENLSKIYDECKIFLEFHCSTFTLIAHSLFGFR